MTQTPPPQETAPTGETDQRAPLEVMQKLEDLLDQMENKLDEFSRDSNDSFDNIEKRLEKMGENLKEMERLSESTDSNNLTANPAENTTVDPTPQQG
ncbi:hypothetical protein IWQ62_000082 [Dispira parvispora]|uniref:Uncharacterized protein n=1 Tax=Dispira parvispora TaxID=1520584 RepID=A0A9W8EA25_9FUNG|nr:hypothetical protein IWQ62_000082 [Dispira parvispora]